MSTFIFKIDHYFAELFHNLYLFGGDIANNIFKIISLIAESGILFLIIGGVLILLKKTRKTGLAIILALGLGFLTTNILLKNIIARSRPFENIGSDFYKWWIDAGAEFEGSHSFPSGHTTATTSFSIAIFLTTNKERSWSIVFLPILMASSRIYLMVHYFTDCLGGLVIGLISAYIAYKLVILLYSRKNKFCKFVQNFNIFNNSEKLEPIQSKSNPTNDYVYQPLNYNEQTNNQTSTKNDNNTSSM